MQNAVLILCLPDHFIHSGLYIRDRASVQSLLHGTLRNGNSDGGRELNEMRNGRNDGSALCLGRKECAE